MGRTLVIILGAAAIACVCASIAVAFAPEKVVQFFDGYPTKRLLWLVAFAAICYCITSLALIVVTPTFPRGAWVAITVLVAAVPMAATLPAVRGVGSAYIYAHANRGDEGGQSSEAQPDSAQFEANVEWNQAAQATLEDSIPLIALGTMLVLVLTIFALHDHMGKKISA